MRILARLTVLLAVLALAVGPAAAAGAGTAGSITGPGPTTYTADHMFDMVRAPGTTNQGLAYYEGRLYVSIELASSADSGSKGRIDSYDRATGRLLSSTGPLPIGHANSIDIRDWKAYLVDGNNDKLHIYDLQTKTLRSFPMALSDGAVGALDRTRNQMVIDNGPTGGPYYLDRVDMASGRRVSHVAIRDYGVTQGIAVYDHHVLLLTSHLAPGGRSVFNDRSGHLTTLNELTGQRIRSIVMPTRFETEGLALRRSTGQVYFATLAGDRGADPAARSPVFELVLD